MKRRNSIDTDELFRLARQKSVESRTALARTVSEFFSSETVTLTERERALMYDILHRVIRDVEMAVRKQISAQMARLPDVRRDLVTILANDKIDVAYPILIESPVLRDADLIGVIRDRTLEHQLAIAIRKDLSESVSAELVRSGNADVIQALLRNRDARIARATMECLVEQSRRIDTFREPILRRAELGADLAKRMFMWVSAALRHAILERFDLPEEEVDDLLESAVLEEVARTQAEAKAPSKCAELADALVAIDTSTPKMLVSVLEAGEVHLFVSMFESMTGLRHNLIMSMMFEPGGERLALACRAIGLEKVMFASIFSLTRRARPNLQKSLREDLRQALSLYGKTSQDSARKVVRMWQRNADYLSAVDSFEMTTRSRG
jgi:uncharacterized protein (DUF2336 family)